MKKLFLVLASIAFFAIFLTSCSHGISMYEAANTNKAKCGKVYIGK